MTTDTIIAISGLGLTQIVTVIVLLINNRKAASESHLLSVEKANANNLLNVEKAQDLQQAELTRLRNRIAELAEKLEALHIVHSKCEIELATVKARLLLLEEFRLIVKENPTPETRAAMPPAPVPTIKLTP